MTRLVFMGTPEFAVPILSALAEQYQVVAVYTRVDKPAGRGKELAESPVKQRARELALPIEQPRTLRHEEAQARLRDYHPDLIVVAAYGLILPQGVLDIPPHGCINTHGSLLPRWRGAAPITHAILAGDVETGITLMQMEAGLDTGPIISMHRLPIARDDTTASLSEKLSRLSAGMLIETLPAWVEGKITPVPQPEAGVTYAGMIKKEDGLIDWTRPAVEIDRAVRAYNPWPTAYTYWNNSLLKLWRSDYSDVMVSEPPGTVARSGQDIVVSTGAGVLMPREIQLAGKRALPIAEFVRGHRDLVGAVLTNPAS